MVWYVSKRIADLKSGMVHGGSNITHLEKTVDLAKGYYSIMISNFHMLASDTTGFKQYYLVAGLGGKKYTLPFGIHLTFEFMNRKGELVSRLDVNGYNLEGVFNAPEEGEYTIQVKYDFNGYISCAERGGARLSFTVLSRDYTY